ncbi:MAG: hypothetical protein ACREM2_09705, partial [Vulcanimicrobiaceae bacterium]
MASHRFGPRASALFAALAVAALAVAALVAKPRAFAAPVAAKPFALAAARVAAPQPDLTGLDLIELQIGWTTIFARSYRPVTAAQLAGGARTGVAAYLFSRGIGSPLLALVPA